MKCSFLHCRNLSPCKDHSFIPCVVCKSVSIGDKNVCYIHDRPQCCVTGCPDKAFFKSGRCLVHDPPVRPTHPPESQVQSLTSLYLSRAVNSHPLTATLRHMTVTNRRYVGRNYYSYALIPALVTPAPCACCLHFCFNSTLQVIRKVTLDDNFNKDLPDRLVRHVVVFATSYACKARAQTYFYGSSVSYNVLNLANMLILTKRGNYQAKVTQRVVFDKFIRKLLMIAQYQVRNMCDGVYNV